MQSTKSKLLLATGLPFFMSWLAGGNTLYTFVKEGTVKAIMVGEGFNRFELALHGHHLNDPNAEWYDSNIPKWEVLPNPDNSTDDEYSIRSQLQKDVGAHPVGIPPFAKVYKYRFEWNELKSVEGVDRLWAREEWTDFAYVVDFPYAVLIDSERTEDNLQVDALYLLTLRINNPFKALFGTEDWLRRVTAAANRMARDYIGVSKYADLSSEFDPNDPAKSSKIVDNFSTPIKELTKKLPDEAAGIAYVTGTAGNYGVTVVAAEPKWFRLSGSAAKDMSDAVVKVYTATQNAEAARLEGEAAAKVIAMKGEAEANVMGMKGAKEAEALTARLKAMEEKPQFAALLAQLDAMQIASGGQGNTQYVWANNPFVQSQPGLLALLEQAGIKSVDDLRKLINPSAGGQT